MNRRAKIVATIGPSSQDEATLRQLLAAGLDIARLNFSHGSHTDHAAMFHRLRAIAAEQKRPVTILMDMQGPKIRTGELAAGKVALHAGQVIMLSTRPEADGSAAIPVDFAGLPAAVAPGGRILLDDGNLELEVLNVSGTEVQTRVVLGGELKSNKGINLPGASLEIPGFTEKDREDLAFGLGLGVDAVAVSFVRSAADIFAVRQAIQELNPERKNLPVIAKLERPDALDNLEEIVLAADGVMVARGDLGVEMHPEEVPIAQKRIISSANHHDRVVITATQMLDSMINNPRPTRAEASDVANAIFDGTDAVMLSGETASGKYPVKAVEMMNAIICQAEQHIDEWGHWQGSQAVEASHDDSHFITLAARELAHDRNVAAIAVFTKSGRTALLLSKTRPGVPILAFTPDEESFHRMGLYWGVYPRLVPHVAAIEEMIRVVEQEMLASTPVQPGQQVVLICGFPVHRVRATNLALLHTVGEPI